ncbi:MAG: acyltransferase [Deltaproteobacteria bacterium]|nr:acyltransferase [Deltaproteobacteria bacterium]
MNYLYNFTIVPLNFSQVSDNYGTPFLHPVWSLGVELQFYAILPFILRLKAFKPYLVLYSILIFSFAAYNLINEQYFCYYLLPGTLFIFLSGSLLYDYVGGDKTVGKYLMGLYLYMLILFVTVIMSRNTISTADGFSIIDVFTGYLLGLPLIFLLSLLKRRKFDEFMGNISYGVFLSHFLIIWFFPYYGIFDPKNNVFLFLSCSMLLGFIGYYFVERPVLQWRRSIRKNAIK